MNNYYPVPYSDSPLSNVSKKLNAFFGDNTGRTITERTATGLKRTLNLHEMEADTAEHIVHGLMILTPVLLKQESPLAQTIGTLLGIGLFTSYQNGKQYTFPQRPNHPRLSPGPNEIF